MFEMDKVNFKKSEVIDVLSKYVGTDKNDVKAIVELLLKLGVISEYVFQDE